MANDIDAIRATIADYNTQLNTINKRVLTVNDAYKTSQDRVKAEIAPLVVYKGIDKFNLPVVITPEQFFDAVQRYIDGYLQNRGDIYTSLGLTLKGANGLVTKAASVTRDITKLNEAIVTYKTNSDEKAFIQSEIDRITQALTQARQQLETALAQAQAAGQINAVEAQNILIQSQAATNTTNSISNLIKENWLPIVGVIMVFVFLAWATVIKVGKSKS